MRIIFVIKVTAVDKPTIVANDATFYPQFGFVFRIVSQSAGLKFSQELTKKFVTVTESAG